MLNTILKNTIVLHNGVDLEDFKNSNNLNKNMDIIFIGNLQDFQNLEILILLMMDLLNLNCQNTFSLKIIGGPEDISNSLKIM